MASIRRTLSPVLRPVTLMNGEACQVASPLSKSSSNSRNYPLSMGSLGNALYKAQYFVLGLLSPQSSRPLDRSKVKGQIWQRAFLHFFICFVIGVLFGLTPFVALNLSFNVMSKPQAIHFEVLQPVANRLGDSGHRNETSVVVVDRLSLNENTTLEPQRESVEPIDGISDDDVSNNLIYEGSNLGHHKLLIIVTPTYARPLQAYYMNRLANTLKLIPHPSLWIVVEMKSQSLEIADLLRKTGVMYRHLVCNKNSVNIKESGVHLRNVALSHIETHRLNGIVYFADDDNIYSVNLFNQMRQIRQFGTWVVAKIAERETHVAFEGPVCNGSQVIGWHATDMTKRFRRFHAEMSGFAFNSTIIWDPKKWNQPTLEPIRHLDTVEEGFQASTFIEQVVEDESQMECIPSDSETIMVWHRDKDLYTHPQIRVVDNGLSIIVPLA
ncbi:probable beta-1,4-xylosyltransferase IRX9H [Olea europaea subsp. europaea]|uniref:Glycosyltransferases n=1 Tax=Olea europaea subsp. europaea TaxID=158383 RepID=A0A8S0PWU7_OLEEU|nr:probable beta-1,4-xylosyltransferase IRX9H [Olea europaea subsp. europaea]